jgi:hypothetical protein
MYVCCSLLLVIRILTCSRLSGGIHYFMLVNNLLYHRCNVVCKYAVVGVVSCGSTVIKYIS